MPGVSGDVCCGAACRLVLLLRMSAPCGALEGVERCGLAHCVKGPGERALAHLSSRLCASQQSGEGRPCGLLA